MNDERIQAIADKANKTRSEVQSLVDEKLQELKDHQASEMDESELEKFAINIVNSDLNFTTSGGFGGGDSEELPILSLGYQFRDGEYFVTDGDAIRAGAIVNPSDAPAGFATLVLDSDHGIDLEYAADVFTPLNTIRGHASKRQVGSRDDEPTLKKGGQPVYVVTSTDDSKFEVVSPDEVSDDDPISELPSDREAKREMIHNNFITDEETVTIENYPEHESVKNGQGFEVGFGADIKRFRGEVVDSIKFSSGDGAMTMVDDTVFEEEDVPEELISDKMRTAGMQIQIAADLIYGEGSVLDVYGFIQQRDEGHYQMQALGVIPIVDFDYDGPDGVGGDNGGSGDKAIDEETV